MPLGASGGGAETSDGGRADEAAESPACTDRGTPAGVSAGGGRAEEEVESAVGTDRSTPAAGAARAAAAQEEGGEGAVTAVAGTKRPRGKRAPGKKAEQSKRNWARKAAATKEKAEAAKAKELTKEDKELAKQLLTIHAFAKEAEAAALSGLHSLDRVLAGFTRRVRKAAAARSLIHKQQRRRKQAARTKAARVQSWDEQRRPRKKPAKVSCRHSAVKRRAVKHLRQRAAGKARVNVAPTAPAARQQRVQAHQQRQRLQRHHSFSKMRV